MPERDPVRPATRCARPLARPASATEPLVPPLQPSAVYRVADLDQIDALYRGAELGYIYARDGQPNAAALAARLAELEGAEAGLVCASGMATESAAALTLLDAGAHVALADSLYGRTTTLLACELTRFGVDSSPFDATDAASLRAVLRRDTRLIVVETISNPLLRVADLDGLAEAAGDVPLLVDNTFAPLICRPIDRGAVLVVHSLTKLIGGHSLAVLLSLRLAQLNDDYSEVIRQINRWEEICSSRAAFADGPLESGGHTEDGDSRLQEVA